MSDDAGGRAEDAPADAPANRTDSSSTADSSGPGDSSGPTDSSSASAAGDARASDAPRSEPTDGPGSGVVVPAPLYRVVTVFSTLVAVASVVAGFAVLDLATGLVSNPPGALVTRVLVALGVPRGAVLANNGAVALVVGLVGLALVVGGAAFYAYGTRFRAPGMGKPKDDAHEGSDDG